MGLFAAGEEKGGQETMQEALTGALQGPDGGTNPYVNLITGFYLENHRKNASEVCTQLSCATP